MLRAVCRLSRGKRIVFSEDKRFAILEGFSFISASFLALFFKENYKKATVADGSAVFK